MSQFDELLKSLSDAADEQTAVADKGADDEVIASAAVDSGVDAGVNPEDEGGDGEGDGKPVAKSMTAQDADGEEIEVVDATELLKSLGARQDEHGGVLAKALETFTAIAKSQTEMIKSLRAEVKTLAGQGRGRKTVVSVAEKPDPTPQVQQAAPSIKREEFLAKCLDAQRAGKLSGHDVTRAETAINNGIPVPAEIVARIQ